MSKGNKPTKGSETMKMKREHQLIRLENAISKGMVKNENVEKALQLTMQLYHNATPENQRVYWTAIRSMVARHDYDLDRYMKGRIPYSIKVRIHDIARETREEVHQAYINIQNKLGFLPIKVNTEALRSKDAIAHDAAMKVFRSIKRRLTMAYKAGGWDGSVESAPNHFGQRSLDAPDFMEVFE